MTLEYSTRVTASSAELVTALCGWHNSECQRVRCCLSGRNLYIIWIYVETGNQIFCNVLIRTCLAIAVCHNTNHVDTALLFKLRKTESRHRNIDGPETSQLKSAEWCNWWHWRRTAWWVLVCVRACVNTAHSICLYNDVCRQYSTSVCPYNDVCRLCSTLCRPV